MQVACLVNDVHRVDADILFPAWKPLDVQGASVNRTETPRGILGCVIASQCDHMKTEPERPNLSVVHRLPATFCACREPRRVSDVYASA